MSNYHFSIYRSIADNLYYFQFTDPLGTKILTGNGNKVKEVCMREIEEVRKYCSFENKFLRDSGLMNFNFCLKSRNGNNLGKSPNYSSSLERENAIAIVKKYAGHALLLDLCEFSR